MKIAIIPLALAFASTAAMAAPATGTISFYGSVSDGGPCPIEVVDPTSGLPARVELGHPYTSHFKNVGDKTEPREFALKITPTAECSIPIGTEVDVTFNAVGSPVGPATDLFPLVAGGTSTPDLAISIRDKNDTRLAPGDTSAMYLLDELAPTLMRFSAHYEAINTPVREGSALANVNFVVNLP
ncbi:MULTISPECIES: fimbrial protein [unclassified Pseudomonas]|jgi:major type 1 subunit fimbrin (pilin)|uniref:fimbrial protein n=1 Tax=unclassified Pseudomonas TaxID=196821 RepID=UPI000C87F43B|nr:MULTISPECIES: fimbrial protein [unclassified Pseudomonas]PNA88881.1 hypothetical protein C1X74_28195 [Pseudomonas sp. GW460-5]PNB54001.1 hypothetical protein C1X73_28775 [Pseudomonas sp. FW305-130]